MIKVLSICALSLALFACGSSAEEQAKSSQNQNSCSANPAVADATTGGCKIRLVSPSPCENIDLSAGKTYEFAWTTDGTFCETPYKLYIGGNPINPDTGENIASWSLSKQAGQISNNGGVFYVSADRLQSLASSDGTFHWLVQGFFGSHPASTAFKVSR
jgi:hypothetical protein